MKKCAFCAEEIQDAATRCKHCGANLAAAAAAARQAKAEKSMTKAVGVFWGIIGAGIFGYVAYRGIVVGDLKSAAICGGFAIAFLLAAPVAWYLGSMAVKEGGPTMIIASSQSELIKQELWLKYGPPLFAVGAVFVIMCYGVLKLVPVDQIVDGSGNSRASVATTAPSQGASTTDTSDASSTQSTQAVSESQSAGSDAVNSAAIASSSASSSAEAQAQQQPVDEAQKAINASLALAAQTTGAMQQPASVATSQDANTAAPVDASSVSTTSGAVPASVSSGIHASFDCAKASSPIEHLICSTPQSADADRRLAAAYSAARTKSNDPNALKADQRNWLANERNVCSDAACLTKVMEARIQKLSAM